MHFRSREIVFRPSFCSELFLFLQPNVMALLSGSNSPSDILLVRWNDLIDTVFRLERSAIGRKVKLCLPTSWRYMGSRGIAPLILDFGARRRWVVNFKRWLIYPRERDPVGMECEAGWGFRKCPKVFGEENGFEVLYLCRLCWWRDGGLLWVRWGTFEFHKCGEFLD
jgi:hypothetical protein